VAVDECQNRKYELRTSNSNYFLVLVFPPNKTLTEYNTVHNFSGDLSCHFFHFKSKGCTIMIQPRQQSRVGIRVEQLKNASYPLSLPWVSIINTLNFLHSLAGHSHVSCIFYSSSQVISTAYDQICTTAYDQICTTAYDQICTTAKICQKVNDAKQQPPRK